MPLPDYSIRSDSFGNYYLGGFQMDSQVELGYGTASVAGTLADFEALLTAAFGATGWATGGTGLYYIRPPVGYDPQTGAVSSTNYRFSTTNPGRLNSTLTGGTTDVSSTNTNVTTVFSTGSRQYAVANSKGIWFVGMPSGGGGELSATGGSAYYMGWVDDPVFPTNTVDRIRNAVLGVPRFVPGLRSAGAENSTVAQANYPSSVITCAVSTPGANVSDVVSINVNSSNLALGKIPNSVFYPGTGLTIGRIYRIPPEQDPDGNTEQNIWLCTSQSGGWDGTSAGTNRGYLLIRVWSNNIT
jgi:hypothetical protein